MTHLFHFGLRRGHDLCFDALMAGQCKNGLCNNSPYTRSPCTCDRQFVSCLKGAKTRIANALGRVFFNIGGMNCYKFDHPIKRCVEFVDVSKNSKVPTWLLKALHVHPEPQKPRYSKNIQAHNKLLLHNLLIVLSGANSTSWTLPSLRFGSFLKHSMTRQPI